MPTRIAPVFLTAALLGASTAIPAAQRPAVIELFTSEGCSSCPPAEQYLGELAQRPDVLALSFHVDYWDDLGWRDRFGITAATPRQRAYAQALRLSTVYTPQMVIDGQADFVGSDRSRIGAALAAVRSGPTVGLEIRGGVIRVDLGDAGSRASGDVVLVAFQRSAVSAIGRGENSGRTLVEHNIVRSLRTLGAYSGSAQALQADVSALPADATDIAVLIQTADHGPIIGAATRSLR